MTDAAKRPFPKQHPLLEDRARLDAIRAQVWIEIQRTMFPGRPQRSLRSPGRTELTLVGGPSADDVYSETIQGLLRYVADGEVNWEALGNTIARRRAIAAIRKARKHRRLPDGSEIHVTTLDRAEDDDKPLANQIAADEMGPDEVASDRALRAERLVAVRAVADEILSQRDRDILFRFARGETYTSIAEVVNLTRVRVGQIHRESVRKINARLRTDPKFRRLYPPEGGTPDA